MAIISLRLARSRRFSLSLSPKASTLLHPLLLSLLKGLEPLDQLFLFLGCHAVSDTRSCATEELTGDGGVTAFDLAF
jgi:hypothetical protein